MIQRALDSNDDWTFGQGIQNFVSGELAMMLNLRTRLREWKNDCFYAPNEGVDYQGYLAIGTKDLLDADIRRVTLSSDGVLRIDSYESVLNDTTRQLSVTMLLFTVYGTFSFSEVV